MSQNLKLRQSYVDHSQSLRKELRAANKVMARLDDELSDSYDDAILHIGKADPMAAKAIETFVSVLLEGYGALNEALYHECERRALAPAVGRMRTAAKAGRAKAKASPAARAKAAAKVMWPTVVRRSWTAERFAMELQRKGHKVASDTVRKWKTSLSKTGTC